MMKDQQFIVGKHSKQLEKKVKTVGKTRYTNTAGSRDCVFAIGCKK